MTPLSATRAAPVRRSEPSRPSPPPRPSAAPSVTVQGDDFRAGGNRPAVPPTPPQSSRSALRPPPPPPAGATPDAPPWQGQWGSAQQLQGWISQNFQYDPGRQAQQSNPDTRTPPIDPATFFANPTGACMDLANFGATAMNSVDPNANAQLMQIDMARTNPDGTTTSWKHWIGVFQNEDGRYVGFADSRGKGNLYDGPDGKGFETPQQLFEAYQAFWNSKDHRRGDVVGWPSALTPPRG